MKNKKLYLSIVSASIIIISLILGSVLLKRIVTDKNQLEINQTEISNKEDVKDDFKLENISNETEKIEEQKDKKSNNKEIGKNVGKTTNKESNTKTDKSSQEVSSTQTTSKTEVTQQETTIQTDIKQETQSKPIESETTTIPQVEEKQEEKIQKISISINDTNLIIGKLYQISIETTPKGLSAKGHWEVSNSSILSVDANGNVKGLKKGEASIVYVTEDGIKSNTLTLYPYYDVTLSKSIYNKNGIKITAYKYMYGKKGTKDACLYMKVENLSGKTITSYTAIAPEMSFSKSGLIVNGKVCGQYETQPTIMANDIDGKKGNTYINIKPEALNNKGIEKINTISFYLVIQNAEDYSKMDITDLITINL